MGCQWRWWSWSDRLNIFRNYQTLVAPDCPDLSYCGNYTSTSLSATLSSVLNDRWHVQRTLILLDSNSVPLVSSLLFFFFPRFSSLSSFFPSLCCSSTSCFFCLLSFPSPSPNFFLFLPPFSLLFSFSLKIIHHTVIPLKVHDKKCPGVKCRVRLCSQGGIGNLETLGIQRCLKSNKWVQALQTLADTFEMPSYFMQYFGNCRQPAGSGMCYMQRAC